LTWRGASCFILQPFFRLALFDRLTIFFIFAGAIRRYWSSGSLGRIAQIIAILFFPGGRIMSDQAG